VIGDKHIASGEVICPLQQVWPIYAGNFTTGKAQSLEGPKGRLEKNCSNSVDRSQSQKSSKLAESI